MSSGIWEYKKINMKDPVAMLKTFTSACCCIMCMMTCACEGCMLYRSGNTETTFAARRLYFYCMEEVRRLKRDERKDLLLAKFHTFQVHVTEKKKYKFVLLIGEGENMHMVCRRGFARAYSISHWYVEDLVRRLKKGNVNCLSDLTPAPSISPQMLPESKIKKFSEEFGIFLTNEQLGSLRLPQTEVSLMCASWLQYYFSLVGDQPPDRNSEIHLDPTRKVDVYNEYIFDMESLKQSPVCFNTFKKIWGNTFSYCKIRKFKSSCGHCSLCTYLSEKRRKFRDRAGREEVTNLYALHRMSIMQERRKYYDRRLDATLNKEMFLSTIMDGMMQNHCFLPWFGNNKHPDRHIKQHLQGVLMHGHQMMIFRTFANCAGGANLAIHTWLLALEHHYLCHGKKLPSVIYHQIDGGSENANVEFYSICALLVACRLVDKVVLTRLPVGHTHEDIDGVFALIWCYLRDQYCLSPSEFASMIKKAVSSKVKVWVTDIFALPDYCTILKNCVDPHFAHAFKEEWTQLQFVFERVTVSEDHPLGVKTTYKAYAGDNYIEIVEDEGGESICGLIPQICENDSHPQPGEPPFNPLLKLPHGDFAPAPFVSGSRNLLETLSLLMQTTYEVDNPEVAAEWRYWCDVIAPKSDSAQDFITTSGGIVPDPGMNMSSQYVLEGGGVYVPFRTRLFGGTGVSEMHVEARERGTRSLCGRPGIRTVRAQPTVQYSGHNSAAIKRIPPRLVIQESDGSLPDEPRGVLNAPYIGREARREVNRKNAAARKREEQERINATRLTESDSEAEEQVSDPESDCHRSSPTFAVGELVSNIHNLRGIISEVHSDNTYDIKYNDGQYDNNLAASYLRHIKVTSSKKRTKKQQWEIVTEPTTEWVDQGALSSENVVTEKRRRSSGVSYKE